jgi:soluble lytic murein transglycosylase-like protein
MAQVRDLVRRAAQRHQVPEDLILGLILVESGFQPDARSPVGARGLMQLMPATARSLARRLGLDDYEITDPGFNIEAGTYYLAYLLQRFQSEDLALAAYNGGPTRMARLVAQGRGLPEYSRRYVAAVQGARRRFQGAESMDHGDAPLDRAGLRALLRERLYGDRPDEPLPEPEARLGLPPAP